MQQTISLDQLRALYEVSQKINSQLDLDLLLAEIMDLAVELLEAEKGLIFIRAKTGGLEPAVARSMDKKAINDVVAMSQSAIEKVAREEVPLLLKGIMGAPPQEGSPSLFRHKLQSILCVPLKASGEVIGVIYLDTTDKTHFFKDKDLPFMQAFANLAGVAIEKAKSFLEVERMNANLEGLVEQRTEELAAKHDELKQAYLDLQETQLSLIRSEKMASLGMLVAGVVHEINTPLGAMRSNTDIFRRSLDKMAKGMANAGEATAPQTGMAKTVTVMSDLVEVNEQAISRIMKIMKGLRNFSRLDEEEVKEVDLHDGLDSTLDLIRHLYVDRVQIVKKYGQIPKLYCRASQLNQVFMNILANACQAIEEEGTIRITSNLKDEDILVSIRDDGVGITPEHVEKLFDPGFTTKGVGVGTGLGLSIAYRIVSEHRGDIQVESSPGKGSTFRVRLPVKGFQP